MSEKVSKKVKQGKIDIDPEQCALVVNFEIEVVSLIACNIHELRQCFCNIVFLNT